MAASSSMLELGTKLPDFLLMDVVTRQRVSSDGLVGSIAVVAFICNHCPYVKYIQRELAAFGQFAVREAVKMVAISSNDSEAYPDDAPARMAEEAARASYSFPYLFDEEQRVAQAFHAVCTPEFYVYDRDGLLAYRGRFDGATPKTAHPPTGSDLRAAVSALLAGQRPNPDQKPSIGCSIKWKPDNEPQY
jgi:hypothetical protein